MTNAFIKICLSLTLPLALSGCFLFASVDHTGLLPPDVEGQVHTVSCRIRVDYLNDDGVPETAEVIETQRVCSNEAPAIDLQTRACEIFIETNEANLVSLRGTSGRVSFFEPESSLFEADAEPCFIPESTEIGGGEVLSRVDMLSNSASVGLRPEEVGVILAKNSLTNSLAVSTQSKVTVGAKFLDWRFAETTAHGEVEFDRNNCKADKTCDLVLRQISLTLDDFTIVRPTVFARDVNVKNARLYSITSHAAKVDSEGRFTVNDMNVIVTSIVDDEQVTLVSSQDFKIEGKFSDNLHGQNHAALTLAIDLKHANKQFSIAASAGFQVRRFPSKLATGKDAQMCLTGGALAIYREARVSQCDFKKPHQVWYFEQKGRYLKIRQPLNNTCLNVKSDSQNYNGGIVSIVNCSDHYDQLWSIDHDFNVVNLHTRKCLDVGKNKKRDDPALVTIHACDSKADGQNWTVQRPG